MTKRAGLGTLLVFWKASFMRYNTPNTPLDNLRGFVQRGGTPVTTTILIVNGVTFLLAFMLRPLLVFFADWVAFNPFTLLHTPWTLLTYPLVYLDVTSNGLWNFLFGGFFFYSWGGSLERSWGTQRYAALFFALSVVSAAFVLLGCYVLPDFALLHSFFLPLAGVTVAFCTMRPEEPVSFIFFPLRAKYLAVIAVIATWVYLGQGGHPLLGLFGCGGLLSAFLYVRFGRAWADIGSYAGGARPAPRGPDLRIYPSAGRFSTRSSGPIDGSPRRSPMDFSGRWKDYQERKRLERLWKNSGFSDREESWQDDDRRR